MAQQDKKDKLVINVRTVPNGYTCISILRSC